ncbi:MAG: hypothetical protein QW385_07415 [Thermoproteota archaeon]
MGSRGFQRIVEALNRLEHESDRDKAVREIALLLKTVDAEQVESLVKIMRMDFGEASRIVGTHLARRIVSEALASITPLKHSEVEDLLQTGKIGEALSRRSTVLLGEELTVDQAYTRILDACSVSGKSSISVKAKSLAGLLNKSSSEEAAFILSIMLGKRRPVGDELILRAVGEAFYGSAGNRFRMISSKASGGDIYKAVKQAVENAGRG